MDLPSALRPTTTKQLGLAIVAAILLITGVVAAVLVSREDAIDQALEIVDDDASFARGDDAGAAFARISTSLRRGADRCQADRGSRDKRCEALFAGSAYAQVAAVTVLECKRPGIFEARETMRTYLKSLRQAPTTQVPNLQRCV